MEGFAPHWDKLHISQELSTCCTFGKAHSLPTALFS